MDTQRADAVRAQTGSRHELTQLVEMATRLDDAFALVDDALAQDPGAQELRAALNRMPMRKLCSLVSTALGQASACAAGCNTVHDKIGSFADEHSTL